MGSDANKMNDATSFQPALCANGCGFFGSAATKNLCSKCFRDQQHSEQTASAKAAVDKLVNKVVSFSSQTAVCPSSPATVVETVVEATAAVAEAEAAKATAAANRCRSCRRKVGVMGFKCRCGKVFCGSHRYPEEHDCEFDFKRTGRDAIAVANPVIKADKVDRI